MQNNQAVPSSTYAFSLYDYELKKTIGFRSVTQEQDLGRLHQWMNQPHVIPYWGLNGTLASYQKHLQTSLEDAHQTLYIGFLDGVPMSYWESYWVKDDVIGDYYSFDVSDQGVHLLIGPDSYVGKGFALPLLRSMVTFQLQIKETNLIVAEPDIRNEKMIHVFKRCGFEAQKSVNLSDKTGLLMFCRRDVFARRWQYVKG